jgi:hypothetical protein
VEPGERLQTVDPDVRRSPSDPEKELRSDIVRALREISAVGDVRETHGSHEYGLDIRYQAKDVFGKAIEVGIQVKAGNITPKDVHSALGQLLVGLGHPNPETSRLPEVIYLVTNGNITEAALKSLDYAKTRMPSLRWVDGTRLDPFLKKGVVPPPFTEEA